ncbi:hypothetical protein AHAS_Ahas11G0198400 [Arachis hypogaea]
MEFNLSYDQTNFMGYYPPSPISNDGWKYHQQIIDPEHSNPWRYVSKPQDEQENHMGYFPPPQNDSSHYSNGGLEYHQELKEYEHLPEPQDDSYCYNNHSYCGWESQNQRNLDDSYFVHQETSLLECAFNKFMQNCPPMLQEDLYYDEFNNSSSCAWEDQNQKAYDSSYSTYQEPSSLEQTFNLFVQTCPTSPPCSPFKNSSLLDYASTQNLLQDPYNSFHQPQNLFHNPQDSFYTTQNNLTTIHPYPQDCSQPLSLELAVEDYFQWSKESLESRCPVIERQGQLLEEHKRSWKEILFKKMDGHLEQGKRNLGDPRIEDKEQSVSEEVKEQEQEAPVSSKLSMKNEVVEVFEPKTTYTQKLIEVTEEHETSLPKDLMEDQAEEGEEVNQEISHSIEAEKCIEEGLMEPPI